MSANLCDKSLTFNRDLNLFVEMVKMSISSSKYGGVGKLDGDPYGSAIIDMLERYDELSAREKQDAATNIAFLMEIQQEFGE